MSLTPKLGPAKSTASFFVFSPATPASNNTKNTFRMLYRDPNHGGFPLSHPCLRLFYSTNKPNLGPSWHTSRPCRYNSKPQSGGTFEHHDADHLPTGASIYKIKFNDLGPPRKIIFPLPNPQAGVSFFLTVFVLFYSTNQIPVICAPPFFGIHRSISLEIEDLVSHS